MALTPTNGQSSFPFAVHCRVAKTFFGVPRKCSNCQKMIILTAGFACKMCSFRAHRGCVGRLWEGREGGRRKLCSLSNVPDGDEAFFAALLRDNELNSNDVDWAAILSSASSPLSSAAPSLSSSSRPRGSALSSPGLSRPSSLPLTATSSQPLSLSPPPSFSSFSSQAQSPPQSPFQSPLQSPPLSPGSGQPLPELRLLPSAESQETLGSVDDQLPNSPPLHPSPSEPEAPEISRLGLPSCDESVMSRFLRLISWRKAGGEAEKDVEARSRHSSFGASGMSGYRSTSGPSSPASVLTPVDEFNHSVLEELFQKRSSSSGASGAGGAGPGPARVSSRSRAVSGERRRRIWVQSIAGHRGAQSVDCVASPSADPASPPPMLPWPDGPSLSCDEEPCSPASSLQPCASWPLLGLHLNHSDQPPFPAFPLPPPTPSDEVSALGFGEWSIPHEDLEFGSLCFRGRLVSTFAGKWHGDVTIHSYHFPDYSHRRFLSEVEVLTKIRHENVALFMGACVSPGRMAVVTSMRRGRSLYDALHVRRSHMSLSFRLGVVRQVAQGMSYLHAKGIVLSALSTRSVFLECKAKICMVNYGGPGQAGRQAEEGEVGPPCGVAMRGWLGTVAPERLKKLRVRPPFLELAEEAVRTEWDVWAFGTLSWETLSGRLAWAEAEGAEAALWAAASGALPDLRGLGPCPRSVQRLLLRCWAREPANRPAFAYVLSQLSSSSLASRPQRSSSDPRNLHRLNRSPQPPPLAQGHPRPDPRPGHV